MSVAITTAAIVLTQIPYPVLTYEEVWKGKKNFFTTTQSEELEVYILGQNMHS